jgi:DNA-binding XRE family transcriptional regulator
MRCSTDSNVVRLGRGLTQQELGDAVDVSNRVIAYYEAEGAQPPGQSWSLSPMPSR